MLFVHNPRIPRTTYSPGTCPRTASCLGRVSILQSKAGGMGEPRCIGNGGWWHQPILRIRPPMTTYISTINNANYSKCHTVQR